jgi:hypothetical protein
MIPYFIGSPLIRPAPGVRISGKHWTNGLYRAGMRRATSEFHHEIVFGLRETVPVAI